MTVQLKLSYIYLCNVQYTCPLNNEGKTSKQTKNETGQVSQAHLQTNHD